MSSVPSSRAVIFTPVSRGSPEKARVWYEGYFVGESPTETLPLKRYANVVHPAAIGGRSAGP